MTQTQINGATQIRQETITSDRIAAGTIADDRLDSSYLKADGTRSMTGVLDMDGYRINYVGTPTDSSDAATKAYVDGLVQGFDWKQSARVATTGPGTLSSAFANGQTVDGVTLVTGDRILVKDQATASENGIYTVNASGAPTRAEDFNTDADVTSGATLFVSEGSTNAGTSWSINTYDPIVLGTSDVVFIQVAGSALYSAGDGLAVSGTTFSAVAANASITVAPEGISVGIGDASLDSTGGLHVVTGSPGQVYIANEDGILTPTTLSGDISSVNAFGGVSLDGDFARLSRQIVRENPSGTLDGVNTDFSLSHFAVAGSECVYLNGILQEPGAGNDYSISSGVITFAEAPTADDRIRVNYTSTS